jgi:RNA polymerase sigma factor (sigma-70 family)
VTVDQKDWLAERFEENRGHLRGVAYRMLGSTSEADDAVQEAWFRLSRADSSEVDNLGGWMTTIVARVCLDILRSRKSRPEEPFSSAMPEPVATGVDPEHETVLADSVGLALLVVLETLSPAERLAFVLHDMFDVPFDEIAPIVGRSPAAARQLASRARRRVQGATTSSDADHARRREVIDAFLAASRSGDFEALLALLDPDVVLRVDEAALLMGVRSGWLTQSEVHGAKVVAEQFIGRAQAAQLALIDGVLGVVWATRGTPRVAFGFTIRNGMVVEIELAADSERLSRLDIHLLDA